MAFSITSQDPTQYKVNGVIEYRYHFSDGSEGVMSPADAAEYVSTKNQLEQLQNQNRPKLPVTPSKINVTTGAGVPGGFDASSVKLPSTAAASANTTIASISSKISAVGAVISAIKAGLIPNVPGIMDASSKLSALQKKVQNKLKAAQSAPNFSKSYVLPSPPPLPSTPDFGSLGIPSLPSLPSLPAAPQLPSLPSVPKLP